MGWLDLDQSETFVYEWQKGMLGSFKNALAELICMGDTQNQAELAKGFPIEVHAIQMYQTKSGWYSNIIKKMEN